MKTISRSTTIASIKKIKIKKRSNKNYKFPDKKKKNLQVGARSTEAQIAKGQNLIQQIH